MDLPGETPPGRLFLSNHLRPFSAWPGFCSPRSKLVRSRERFRWS